jgi:hypothetical protein
MAQRTFSRGAISSICAPQLNALIDAALGLTGCITSANLTTIFVDHPSLTSANDAAIQTVINAYVIDNDFGIPAEIIRLRTFYTNLATWADSAALVDTNWSGNTYTATKDGQLRILYRNISLLANGLRDLLFALSKTNG